MKRIELRRERGRCDGLRFVVRVHEDGIGLPRESWVELDDSVPEWMGLLGPAGAVLALEIERAINKVLGE